MNTLCELVLALGFTLGGACEDPNGDGMPLPSEDGSAWEFKAAPPPPAPKPEPVKVAPPAFPPVVIEKTVLVQAPPPPPKPKPIVVYRDPPAPDQVALALQATLGNRLQGYVPLEQKAVLNLPEGSGAALPSPTSVSLPAVSAPISPRVPGLLDAPLSPEEYQEERREASDPVNNEWIVTADRYITGILETGINSQLDSEDGGTAIIQTSEDVFGYHGRNILIPKGSRMICDYGSPKKQGSTRLALECKRILMGETRAEIFDLQATVGNQQGHAGITGEVDNRWWEKYGSAVLLSTISATVQGVASIASNTAGSDSGTNASAAQESAAQLSERFGEISASVLEQTVNLAPVIRIMQGTRVQIRPRFDWYIKPQASQTSPVSNLKATTSATSTNPQ
ncbi:MAG: TrbI/VirB10 family protein [Sneathiella sp.]